MHLYVQLSVSIAPLQCWKKGMPVAPPQIQHWRNTIHASTPHIYFWVRQINIVEGWRHAIVKPRIPLQKFPHLWFKRLYAHIHIYENPRKPTSEATLIPKDFSWSVSTVSWAWPASTIHCAWMAVLLWDKARIPTAIHAKYSRYTQNQLIFMGFGVGNWVTG